MNDYKDPDIDFLQSQLTQIAVEARKLPWYKERPWSTDSHVWREKGVPIIDLHDLNTRLARKVIKATGRKVGELETGCLCYVTGVGSHSMGDSPIAKMATGILSDIASHNKWGFHPLGPGRLVIISDPEKAPDAATGKLGRIWWVGIAFFFVLFFFVLLRSCWPN